MSVTDDFAICSCLIVTLAACSSHPQNHPDAGTPHPGPAGNYQVSIGPIPLMPGQETTVCSTVRLTNSVDIDVVEMQAQLAPGSHHLILYKSSATTEAPTPTPCQPFEGITGGDTPIVIAETLATKLTLPKAAAYQLKAGEMVKLEAHYINTTPNPLQGMGTIVLIPGNAGPYQKADIMFCGSIHQLELNGVPPDTQRYSLDAGFYGGGGDVDFTKLNVFAFTSHEHHLGSDVTISKSTSATTPGTQLFDNTSWDHPPLQSYDDAHLLTFAAGEGFRWQCSYDSLDASPKPTSTTYFGLSAQANEMCFIWAYYYPSVGRFIGTHDCAQ